MQPPKGCAGFNSVSGRDPLIFLSFHPSCREGTLTLRAVALSALFSLFPLGNCEKQGLEYIIHISDYTVTA